MLAHILTQSGVSIVIPGRAPISVSSDHADYAAVLSVLKNSGTAEDIDEILNRESKALEKAVSAIEAEFPDLKISHITGNVTYAGQNLGSRLAATILRQLAEGFDLRPIARFIQKLAKNPSNRVWAQLYDFLEAGSIPITEEGNFRVYKAIRHDWLDIHSASMDNSVGQVVTMNRNHVDDDPEVTCSHGLHVCSYAYLAFFARAEGKGRVVECDVSPEDVVAIPKDYNNTKMRVCRYTVVTEIPGYYEGQGDVLSNSSVVSDSNRYPFQVRVAGALHEQFESLSEAASAFEDAVDDAYDYETVSLVNAITENVIHQMQGKTPEVSEDDDGDDDGDYED